MPDQEVLDVTLAVKDVTPSDTNALQDVVVDNETSEITLYVEQAQLATNGKLDFTLLNLAEGITFTGNDSVTGTRESSPKTNVKVELPSKLGNYSFTLTSENKSKMVTVHVIDATMPTSYAFRSWREEDINSISEDQKAVKDNTTHVKATSGLFTNDTDVKGYITFKGNVNTMIASEDGGKYYRVRIKVEGIKAEDVIAVNKDDVTKKYEVTAIDKNGNEVYVKLNANDSVVNLVLANKNASKEQIEKEAASCHKVTFESTSKIWLRNARVAKNVGSEINGDKVTKVIIDKQNNQTIDVGVKFNELEILKLTSNADGSVTAKKENGGDKWIPFVVKVSNDVANKENSVRNAVYVDNENVMINKTINGENGGNEVVLWVKGNLEEKIDFTLHYVKGSEKEDLPITVILHDATTPIIQSATTGSDVNSKGVIISGIESSVRDVSDEEHDNEKIVSGYNVNVDTYKYAMDTVTMKGEKGSAVEGRWYSVVLKTNVPVSSLVYNDGTDEEPNWKPFPITEGNTITIWINRDSTEEKNATSVQQTIANKYAIGEDENGTYQPDSNKAWTVGVTVTETEKSKTMTAGEFYNSADYTIYNDETVTEIDVNRLYKTTIEEIKKDTTRKDDKGNEYGSIKYNLQGSKTKNTTITNKTEKGVTTSTIKTDSKNISEIKINGTSGKWILVQLAVRGNTNTLKNETGNDDAVILDLENRDKLLTGLKGTSSKADLIPLWINLSDPDIVAATKHGDKSGTPFKVTISSTDPVKETNSFYLVFEDKHADAETLTKSNAEPKVFGEELTSKKNDNDLKTELKSFFTHDTSEPFCTNDTKAKALLENIERLQKAETTYDYVGDTVYINIKDDFTQYTDEDSSSTMRIALNLNLETLGVKKNDNMCFYNDGTKKWVDTQADYDNGIYFTIQLNGSDYTNIHNNKTEIVKEYIFAVNTKNNSINNPTSDHNADTDKCSSIKDGVKYIRYVITLTPTK